MTRAVWIYISAPSRSLASGSGPSSGTGGAEITLAAQHWSGYVDGHGTYQAGSNQNRNVASFRAGDPENSVGRFRAGVTEKTVAQMDGWMQKWNVGQKEKTYNLLTNSCQTFASKFVDFLCEGQCDLPDRGGLFADGKHVAVGTGDLLQWRPNDNVRAMVGNANAEVRFDTGHIRAGAEATYAAIQINTSTGVGLVDNNLRLQAEGAFAAQAGVRADMGSGWVAASVGAHMAEASAGPFAARAGVKFGGGLENGVPVLHAGPVSAPCSLM